MDLFEDKFLSEKKIMVEVCVLYLYFYDKDYEILKGCIKCNLFIKILEDWNVLCKVLFINMIDVIGIDYVFYLLKEKEGGVLKVVLGMLMI